jgi:antitoxin MazE
MTTKVQKWGSSLGVRLPKEVARRFRLKAGSTVSVSAEEKEISIKPVGRSKPSLIEIMQAVNPHNQHTEADFGHSAGKEPW